MNTITRSGRHAGSYTMKVMLTLLLCGTSLIASAASVTLAWDHSPDPSVVGYRIYYGASPTAMNAVIDVKTPAATSFIVENLAKGSWYFAVAGYTTTGTEGLRSNIASKTIG